MRVLLFLPFLAILFSCNKIDPPLPEETASYDTYSASLNPILRDVYNPKAIIGPFIFNDKGTYKFGCFNPTDPYEIIYLKNDSLYFFSFKNGLNSKIANISTIFPPHWGKNGWILLYLSDGVFKVKPNGDSLVKLTNSKYDGNFSRWNINSTLFYSPDGLLEIKNESGGLVKSVNKYLYIYDWENDSTLICAIPSVGKGFYRYHIYNDTYEQLYSGVAPDKYGLLIPPHNSLYCTFWGGGGKRAAYIRYDYLNNSIDTLLKFYDSYFFSGTGSYAPQTNTCVYTLTQESWKDSLKNEIYQEWHLLLVHPDGSNPRIITIPD